jgi:hypothetical protein
VLIRRIGGYLETKQKRNCAKYPLKNINSRKLGKKLYKLIIFNVFMIILGYDF